MKITFYKEFNVLFHSKNMAELSE